MARAGLAELEDAGSIPGLSRSFSTRIKGCREKTNNPSILNCLMSAGSTRNKITLGPLDVLPGAISGLNE